MSVPIFMDYQDLKEQTAAKSEEELADYKKLFSLACIGGGVKNTLKGHLENASNIDEFYASVYADDDCRFENAWGYYAKMQGNDWPKRFECEQARYGVQLQLRGVAVENETIQFFIPMMGRSRRADVYIFADGKFNEEAADYFTSVSGTFTCLDMEFAGTYDIFVGPRLIIFERWEFDKLGNRLNGKGETKMCCSCR